VPDRDFVKDIRVELWVLVEQIAGQKPHIVLETV
jgi:hypothetical protein